MVTFIVSAVVAVVALVGGGYLGYKYGRSVEANAQAAYAAAQAVASQVKGIKLGA